MNIRKAVLADSLILSTLCMDVQQLHVDPHPEFFKAPKSVDFAEAFFREMLEKETVFIYIAKDGGDALGYVFCNLVDKPENPFTFARRFLMRELGVPWVELGTWDFNTNAHVFFERMGYRQRHLQYWKILE